MNHTVIELRKMAKSRGIRGYSKWNKAELVKNLFKTTSKRKSKSPIRKSVTKRKSPIRKSVTKRKSPIRKLTTKRKSPIRKSVTKRKSPIRKSPLYETSLSHSEYIYNPYIDKRVEINSPENCSSSRYSVLHTNRQISENLVKQYCDILPLDRIDYIVGPYTYTEYKIGEKTISIFGEAHADKVPELDKSRSVLFSSFLQSLLLEKKAKLFDFYIEAQYVNKDRPKDTLRGGFMLSLIREELKDCIKVVKDCQYKNLRAHYIDFRAKDFEKDFGYKIAEKIERFVFHFGMSLYLGASKYYDLLFDYNYSKYMLKDVIPTIINNDPKIKKQLDNSIYGDKIRSFILSEYKRYYNSFEQISAEYRFIFKKGYDKKYDHIYRKYIDCVMNMLCLLMDIYALGRIFRKFKDASEPTNCIVYVGGVHAKTYNKFIEETLGVAPIIKTAPPIDNIAKYSIKITPQIKSKSALF